MHRSLTIQFYVELCKENLIFPLVTYFCSFAFSQLTYQLPTMTTTLMLPGDGTTIYSPPFLTSVTSQDILAVPEDFFVPANIQFFSEDEGFDPSDELTVQEDDFDPSTQEDDYEFPVEEDYFDPPTVEGDDPVPLVNDPVLMEMVEEIELAEEVEGAPAPMELVVQETVEVVPPVIPTPHDLALKFYYSKERPYFAKDDLDPDELHLILMENFQYLIDHPDDLSITGPDGYNLYGYKLPLLNKTIFNTDPTMLINPPMTANFLYKQLDDNIHLTHVNWFYIEQLLQDNCFLNPRHKVMNPKIDCLNHIKALEMDIESMKALEESYIQAFKENKDRDWKYSRLLLEADDDAYSIIMSSDDSSSEYTFIGESINYKKKGDSLSSLSWENGNDLMSMSTISTYSSDNYSLVASDDLVEVIDLTQAYHGNDSVIVNLEDIEDFFTDDDFTNVSSDTDESLFVNTIVSYDTMKFYEENDPPFCTIQLVKLQKELEAARYAMLFDTSGGWPSTLYRLRSRIPGRIIFHWKFEMENPGVWHPALVKIRRVMADPVRQSRRQNAVTQRRARAGAAANNDDPPEEDPAPPAEDGPPADEPVEPDDDDAEEEEDEDEDEEEEDDSDDESEEDEVHEVPNNELVNCLIRMGFSETLARFLVMVNGLDIVFLTRQSSEDIRALYNNVSRYFMSRLVTARQPQVVVPMKLFSTDGLLALREWGIYCLNREQYPLPKDFTLQVFNTWKQRVVDLARAKEAAPPIKEFNDIDKLKSLVTETWLQWKQKLITRSRRHRNYFGTPLAYLLRDDPSIHAAREVTYSSLDDDLIATTKFSGPQFQMDNRALYDAIEAATIGGPCYAYIMKYKTLANGRLAYMALKALAEGEGNFLARRNIQYQRMQGAKFDGTKTHGTFDAYTSTHKTAHNELEVLNEPVPETKKVIDFLNGITAPNLQNAKDTILSDVKLHGDFDKCAEYMLKIATNRYAHLVKTSTSATHGIGAMGRARGASSPRRFGNNKRKRSSSSSNKGKKSGTRIENKMYPWKQYKNFNAKERQELYRLKHGSSDQSSASRSTRVDSSVQSVKKLRFSNPGEEDSEGDRKPAAKPTSVKSSRGAAGDQFGSKAPR